MPLDYDCRNQKGVIPLDGIKSFHDHAIRRKLWNKAFNITSAKEHAEDLKSCVDELLTQLEKRAGVVDIAAWIQYLSWVSLVSFPFISLPLISHSRLL